MSNPLLRPNDPRFQKPQLSSGADKNPFAEPVDPPDKAATSDRGPPSSAEPNVFAPFGSADEPRPYAPAYTAQQNARTPLLLFLGILGWCAALIGAVSLTGIFDIGWLAPLLGLGPSAAGWLLAHEDSKAIRVGAISADAQPFIRQAFWLGLTGLIACAGIVAAMIFREMHFLPDVF
jgi:hypothetical protein